MLSLCVGQRVDKLDVTTVDLLLCVSSPTQFFRDPAMRVPGHLKDYSHIDIIAVDQLLEQFIGKEPTVRPRKMKIVQAHHFKFYIW